MRMLARLIFLAFVGMTGFVTYNALYMQQLRSTVGVSRADESDAPPEPTPRAVTTDMPDLLIQEAPEQLVTAIQRELTSRGYAPGPVDGKLRDETRKAISAFEKAKGLPVTGTPTDELLRFIILGETLIGGSSDGAATASAGSSGQTIDPVVKKVQQILADLGYAPGPIDGAMSGDTERAIVAFQRDRKLETSGRVTPEVLAEIKRVTGRDVAGMASKP
jgi:peptidoglycan hydrolase-like protein with peptidoglycan-binding domain